MDTEERPGFLRLEELSPAAEQVAEYGTAIVRRRPRSVHIRPLDGE